MEPSMEQPFINIPFTHIPELDIEMLQYLYDDDLYRACMIDQYTLDLCHRDVVLRKRMQIILKVRKILYPVFYFYESNLIPKHSIVFKYYHNFLNEYGLKDVSEEDGFDLNIFDDYIVHVITLVSEVDVDPGINPDMWTNTGDNVVPNMWMILFHLYDANSTKYEDVTGFKGSYRQIYKLLYRLFENQMI